MEAIRNSYRAWAIIGGLIVSLIFIHAQTINQSISSGVISLDDPNVNWNALSDFEMELMALEATTPLPAESVTRARGYYSAQFLHWPPLPGNPHGLPLWPLGQGTYLLDDRQFDYSAISSVKAETMNAMTMETSLTGEVGDGGMTLLMFGESGYTVDYGTNLWIANFAISSNQAAGILSNSVADISYEIQYKHNLVDPQWLSAGFVLGSEATNWTVLAMSNVSLTNNAFFRIRSWEDDGSGLPLWWQMQYFGTTGIDPYGDPDGDGWYNLLEFQNGTDPLGFYLPPAQQGLIVSHNPNTSVATARWLASSGPVTGYTLQRSDNTCFNLSPGATSYLDTVPLGATDRDVLSFGPTIYAWYRIQAQYAGGSSDWSDWVALEPSYSGFDRTKAYALADTLHLHLLAGPLGSAFLLISALPANTAAIRLTRIDFWAEDREWDSSYNTNFDIAVSAFTNGLYAIPAGWLKYPLDGYNHASYCWWAQVVDTNGGCSAAKSLTCGYYFDPEPDNATNGWLVPPYYDGRIHLKQNLTFKLRAATKDFPFAFTHNQSDYVHPVIEFSTNCVVADYLHSEWPGNDGEFIFRFNALWPFIENTLLRNFVFSDSDAMPNTNWPYSPLGHLATGVWGNYDNYYDPPYYPTPLLLEEPATYQFQLNTPLGGTIPALLPSSSTQWQCSYALDSPIASGYLSQIGITWSWGTGGYNVYTMASGAKN